MLLLLVCSRPTVSHDPFRGFTAPGGRSAQKELLLLRRRVAQTPSALSPESARSAPQILMNILICTTRVLST